MNEISSFRFWCQKVLPAVYDDSLSYYELLNKVVSKLNEVITSQNGTNENVKELAAQFEQLKNDLQNTIEEEAEKIVDEYVKTNNLVKSVNGISPIGQTGNITLTASDVGAIANVNGSVKTNNIEDLGVTAGKLANGAVSENKITTGAVTSGKIAQDAVTASKLANGAVATAKIADGAVTGDKLSSNAVTTAKIADKNVTGDKIADKTITQGNIAPNAVDTTELNDLAVSEAKIQDGAVTGAKLSGDAIPVKSVNGKTGAVELNSGDVGAIPNTKDSVTNDNLSGGITADKLSVVSGTTNATIVMANLDNTFVRSKDIGGARIVDGTIQASKLANQGKENAGKLLKIDSNGQPAWMSGEGTVTAGVESVNGKDGAVTLKASDVGAIPNSDRVITGAMLTTYISSEFIPILRTTYNQPSGSFRSTIRGGVTVNINEDDTVTMLESAVQLTGTLDMRAMPLTKISSGYYEGWEKNKILVGIGENKINYFDAVLSVNNKTGNVTLDVDDINGALKEVAPSNVLTGQSINGAYLFLAPDDGKTDAFQKVNKLPASMLPEVDGATKIKAGSIGTGQLADNAVTTAKIENLAVATGNIANEAITNAKIGASAVLENNISNGAVTLAKLRAPGSAESGKMLGVNSSGAWELQTTPKSVKELTCTATTGHMKATFDGVKLHVVWWSDNKVLVSANSTITLGTIAGVKAVSGGVNTVPFNNIGSATSSSDETSFNVSSYLSGSSATITGDNQITLSYNRTANSVSYIKYLDATFWFVEEV